MKKNQMIQAARDYDRIARAIKFISEHHQKRPSLDEMATAACLSPYHFQRMFRRWAGLTPSQFMRFLTLDFARGRLTESSDLLAVSLDAGLSGPGRLHDLFVAYEAMSPGEYKRQAAGVQIDYGLHPTPFGQALIGLTARGICHLSFLDKHDRTEATRRLTEAWPGAELRYRPQLTEPLVRQMFFGDLAGRSDLPFHLLLRGTNFQVNVWRALMCLPTGSLVSYSDLARLAGSPEAHRAVASAVANNPIAYIIPCHRVIAKSGVIHNYRWGAERKCALIGFEAARLRAPDSSRK